jgi:fibronectin type 3 domain-containing protein/TolB-like protein
MRKAIAFCLLVLLACTTAGPFPLVADAAVVKPKIALFMLVPKNIEAIPLIDSIPSLLTMGLSKFDYFEIIERKKIEKEIELGGYKLGSIKTQDLFILGEKLGFDFCVVGDVLKQRGTLEVNIKVVDIRAQKVSSERTFTTTEGRLNLELNSVVAMIMERTRELSPAAVAPTKEEVVAKPPQDLKVKSGTKTIRISWNHTEPQQVSGFKVYRAKNEEGPYVPIGTVDQMFFVDEDPVLREPAFYRVAAVNVKGAEGDFSNPIKAWMVEGPPPPIFVNLEADIKVAYLKWMVRPGYEAARVKLYRREESEKDFKEITSLSGKDITITDRGLKDDTTYYYALTVMDAKGNESDLSKILETKTLKSPDGLKAEGGKIRRINLGWNIHPSDIIEGYVVYRAADKTKEYGPIAKIKDRKTNTYIDKEGLGDATTYWFRVSAINKNGQETDPSEAVSAATRGVPPTPQGFAGKDREARRISLRWEPVRSPEDEIRGYYIFRGTEEKGEYKNITRIKSPDTTSFVDNDPPLKDNTAYYYRISSYNSVEVAGELSAPIGATTKSLPAMPGGVEAKSGEVKQVTLSWQPNPEKDIKEYLIFRSGSGDKELSKIASVKGATSYVDKGLKDGTKYAYSLKAVDEDNLMSEPSPSITVDTKPLPQKPSGLMITEKEDRKLLQWDANPEKDVKQYAVYRKGFLGMSQKIAVVQENSWMIPSDMKGKNELFVKALDETGLESEGSDPMVLVLDKK